MCELSIIQFFIESINIEEFQNKRVLEVGSKYVNGSIRPIIEKFLQPKEYIGIDIEPGKYVDMVLPAERIVENFGEESFDILISTETIEHIKDWKVVITNMKKALRSGGYIFITTRSKGFQFHGFPFDMWRYEIKDMREIFSDFEITKLIFDQLEFGVFLKAKKPVKYVPYQMDNLKLYSMIKGKRINYIPNFEDITLIQRIKFFLTRSINKFENVLKRIKLTLT